MSPNHKILAAIFGASGVVHFVKPSVFEPIVPRWLPAPRTVVYVSGAAELLCSAGLLAKRRWAPPLSAGVLVAVWPANVQMAVDASRARHSTLRQAALWLRVPLQVPLIRMALARSVS